MKDRSQGWFSSSITNNQARDSGMAAVLILLLTGIFTGRDVFFLVAAAALLMNMIFPRFFYPFAILWFGIAAVLGAIVSKILLSAIYLVIVLPVATARRLMGKDTLMLKKFKKSGEPVMRPRSHVYEAADLEKPF